MNEPGHIPGDHTVGMESIVQALRGSDPERRARALAFQQLKVREEISGVGSTAEPATAIVRYLDGELTIGELVDLRLRPALWI